MSYTPLPVESFGGLNLADDPGEVNWAGAIDDLNVDRSHRGRLASRPGYATYNGASVASERYVACGYVPRQQTGASEYVYAYRKGADTHLANLAVSGGGLQESSSLAIASVASGTGPLLYAPYGTSTSEYVFFIDPTGTSAPKRYQLSSNTWSSPAFAGGEAPDANSAMIAVTPWDNRLVVGGATNDPSRVRFSNAGDPLTFPANNFISLGPNRESLKALAAWQNLLFAFTSGAMYVFYGTSTDSTGNPIFNFRRVETGRSGPPSTPGAVLAASDGLYYATYSGVYKTTGGEPVEISQAIRPLITGEDTNGYYTGNANFGFTMGLFEHANHIVVTSTANTFAGVVGTAGLWLVYGKDSGNWSVWEMPHGGNTAVATTYDGGHGSAIYFPNRSGDMGFSRMFWLAPDVFGGATDDNGTAITTRYRSGFREIEALRPGGRRRLRQWRLRGTGTPTFAVSVDGETAFGTAGGTATTVDLDATRYCRVATVGREFSWQVSSTSGSWRLDALVADAA